MEVQVKFIFKSTIGFWSVYYTVVIMPTACHPGQSTDLIDLSVQSLHASCVYMVAAASSHMLG